MAKKKTKAVKLGPRVFKIEVEATQKLCQAIGTPRALAVWLLLEYQQWDELLALSINASHYDNHSAFADDYLVTMCMQKNPRLPTNVDKRAVALDKWYAAEARCKAMNQKALEFCEDPNSGGPEFLKLVTRVRAEIKAILSSHPSQSDLEYAYEHMRFGPGATTTASGIVTQGFKYSSRVLSCTPSMVGFRAFCFPDLWKANVREVALTAMSKLTTVPKNAKTDRVICIEPDLNIFFQLGVGACLRRRLSRTGVDLSSQEVNRTWAEYAHVLDLATIDLSAASDTISSGIVRLLFPPAWVELLEMARTPATCVDGSCVALEKWSSMGNGYTFELETILFLAIARAVAKMNGCSDVCVTAYGDDIIAPVGCLPELITALDSLGFSVNKEKTFGKGLFHESCGADFFAGHNVRPFFFRSELHDFESICYLYANNIRRWSYGRTGHRFCDARCLPSWLSCFTAVKAKHRHLIPEGYGDCGFIADFDRARPSTNRKKYPGWCGYWFFYRRLRCVERVVSVEGSLLAKLNRPSGLSHCSDQELDQPFSSGREALRGRWNAAATKVGYVIDWPNLGPWV